MKDAFIITIRKSNGFKTSTYPPCSLMTHKCSQF